MLEEADATVLVARLAISQSIPLTDLVSGRRIDGIDLQSGDVVLLSRRVRTCVDVFLCNTTQQTMASQNGPWIVGRTPSDLTRPPKYIAAAGRQYFVSAGAQQRGTFYVCVDVNAPLRPVLSRPTFRDGVEEGVYVRTLVQIDGGVRSSRLAPPTTLEDDQASKEYIESLKLNAVRLGTPVGCR